ncbi:MAG: class I SAM-dependent methyltransferase [Methanomicrobiales archaeon]|nr:class I SAM-dependent methyltransferase [Methanomicrobiales archaeon]
MTDISSIDWNEVWKHPEPGRPGSGEFVPCIERWSEAERCRKFDRMAKADNWQGSWKRIHAMQVSAASRVLDVGAGPGTLAVPLSGIVHQVTAVEPAPGMVECLYGNIRESSISNITVIEKKWEDVDLAKDLACPYDVVVASYSLGVPDLKEALQKMDTASSRFVYIFWFADMQSPWRRNYGSIWEQLFGVPDREIRRPNIIFNLLNQMGIYANVEVTREEHVTRFTSFEEAVSDQAAGLKLTTDAQRAILASFLKTRLHHEDGMYVLRGKTSRAKIWWEKER